MSQVLITGEISLVSSRLPRGTSVHLALAERVTEPMHVRRRILSCLVLMMGLSLLSGCKVTGEDIDYWKRTQKGPGKIVAVMLADRYPIDLRIKAALALVEMERQDEDGVALLQQSLQTLQSQDAGAVEEIVAGMVPGLLEMMSGSDENADDDLGPPPRQTRAKDAAYLLIPHASPQARQQLTDAVVGWYAADFANRSLAGNYSAEQVVRSLGSPAARQMVEGLNAHMPQQALVKVTELIGQIGDEETKQAAGERLVAIEREMESSEFIDWLKSEIREAMEGQEVSDDRITNIAVVNRENFLNDGAFPAMKHLAGQDAVRTRLLEVASAAPPASMPAGAQEAINLRRQKALMALEGNIEEPQLDQVLTLALDENNPINVRDYAFDRVGDARSRTAIPRLWPLVESADNDDLKKRLRWRAGELVLALGGSDVIPEFLTKLPGGDAEYEPEELEGYATRMSQMTPQPVEVVERQLSAPEWFKRVLALRFIERRGTQADVAKMQRLSSDRAETVGDSWERLELTTVGAVATDAIEELQERLASPDDEPAAAEEAEAAEGGE